MSYKIRRSLTQATIQLMLISLIASTLAGLISVGGRRATVSLASL